MQTANRTTGNISSQQAGGRGGSASDTGVRGSLNWHLLPCPASQPAALSSPLAPAPSPPAVPLSVHTPAPRKVNCEAE
ncbi:unnamed protein product [Gadus morhua 'NCC']